MEKKIIICLVAICFMCTSVAISDCPKKCPYAGRKTHVTRVTVNIGPKNNDPIIDYLPGGQNIVAGKSKRQEDPNFMANKIVFLQEVFSDANRRTNDDAVKDYLNCCLNANTSRIIYESCYSKYLEEKIADINAPEEQRSAISSTAKALARQDYETNLAIFQQFKDKTVKKETWKIIARSLAERSKKAAADGDQFSESITRLKVCEAVDPTTKRRIYNSCEINESAEAESQKVLDALAGNEPNSPGQEDQEQTTETQAVAED